MEILGLAGLRNATASHILMVKDKLKSSLSNKLNYNSALGQRQIQVRGYHALCGDRID